VGLSLNEKEGKESKAANLRLGVMVYLTATNGGIVKQECEDRPLKPLKFGQGSGLLGLGFF
jgi:hypothetical protein